MREEDEEGWRGSVKFGFWEFPLACSAKEFEGCGVCSVDLAVTNLSGSDLDDAEEGR